MSGTTRPAGVPVGVMVLSVAVLLFWALQLAMQSDLSGGDAAGNAMAQGFAAIEFLLLWLLLGVLVLLAGLRGGMPGWVLVATFGLLLLSGIAVAHAQDLLADPEIAPFRWPMSVTAVVVPAFVVFSLWAALPALRARLSMSVIVPVLWACAALGAAAVLPMEQARESAVRAIDAELARWEAAYKSLPPDAPLWAWTALLVTASGIDQDRVLDTIRHLDRRQNDAETMLARGDFPLLLLGRMDLTLTPAICERARSLLRVQSGLLVLRPGETKPYAAIDAKVAGAVAAIEWLVGHGCACDAESRAWETMAGGYTKPGFDVVRLRELRDPNELGRIPRERPEHFSQLTERSHLMAWLRYAQDASLRQRALAGARALPRRNEDALDMLDGSEFAAWDALAVLPELDLTASPDLCESGLREVRRELARIHQPGGDDPRPYAELLERMGTGRPLPALLWLAGHGCAAEPEIADAEGLVLSYEDSPGRADMLNALRGSRRGPGDSRPAR